jgi:hypothetical protein
MIAFGKIALLVWALGMAYVGYTLVLGAGNAALTGFANGNIMEGTMQMGFVVLVAIGSTALFTLFLTLGVLRE